MRKWSRKKKDEQGVILVGAMITMMFLMAVTLAIIEFSVNHYSSTRRTLVALNALSTAEAGAESFMFQINNNSNYQGTNNAPTDGSVNDSCSTSYTTTPVQLANNFSQGKLTYETCVKNGTIANEKIIFSTGKVYLPASAATPLVTRKLKIIVTATTIPDYAVQTGNGGLIMRNYSSINGSVYLNGRLNMDGNSVIGTIANPAHLWVAGYGCGTGSSYPALCQGIVGQSDLPIFVSNPANVYGDVHAPNMTGSNTDAIDTRARMTQAGLVDASAPLRTLPDNERSLVMNRTSFNNAAPSSADCSNSSDTKTWNAGSHFTGNVTLNGSNCTVTVKGDIWIDGTFAIKNYTTLVPDPSLTSPPVIMIDGSGGFQAFNNSGLITNSNNIGFHVNTYWSAAGVCGISCPVPTGQNLLNSTNTDTMSFSGSFTGANSQFYAVWSGINVANSTVVGALIAQKITLSNSGFITIGQASNLLTGTWDVKYWEQIY